MTLFGGPMGQALVSMIFSRPLADVAADVVARRMRFDDNDN